MTATTTNLLTQRARRESASTELCWQLHLSARPRRVFCALVQTATERGRLLAVENFGQTLVFAPNRCSSYPGTPLKAMVRDDGHGSLLTFTPAQGPRDERAVAAEAESVGSLIRQLRDHFAPPAA
jgi:hypothetical protein